MRCDLILSLLAVLAVGCPRSAPPPTSGETSCARSVRGDTATARARLDKGRVEEALLYIDGLVDCPEAVASSRFLLVALDVYEEAGRLNEAWSVGATALDSLTTDDPVRVKVKERLAAFDGNYVLLLSPRDGRAGLPITHTGAVQDEATRAQLSAVRTGRGVLLPGGYRGFWLYPGRYALDGALITLVAGQRVEDPRP